jgi:hypothetical protein
VPFAFTSPALIVIETIDRRINDSSEAIAIRSSVTRPFLSLTANVNIFLRRF